MSRPRIHLEGMGVVGSILAIELDVMGVDFTWSDVGRMRTSWQACTGCVFPSGNPPDEHARLEWNFVKGVLLSPDLTESAPYVFGSKKPPHGGDYTFSQSVFGLNIAGQDRSGNEVRSIHVNAQRLVPQTRDMFREREVLAYDHKQRKSKTKGAPPCDIYLVTHGFGKLLAAEWWGWTVPVIIHTIDPTLPQRACYYKHLGPAKGPNYAYPIPGTDYHYAGSTLRKSTQAGDLEKEYAKWLERFLEWTKGAVAVTRAGDGVHGWRPSATKPALSKEVPEQWVHPIESRGQENAYGIWPCATDGIRRAPLYLAAVKDLLDHG